MSMYRDPVSIFRNRKGNIALEKDLDGEWHAPQAPDILAKMLELATTHKAPIDQWAVFVPADVQKGKAHEGNWTPATLKAAIANLTEPCDPVLLSNKFGVPFIALAKASKARKSDTSKPSLRQKLA